jgi:Histone methylation protein DOT1
MSISIITTEYLQWCITWTLAFPVISSTLLCLYQIDTSENEDTVISCDDINHDDDNLVWQYIAFHCIWKNNHHTTYQSMYTTNIQSDIENNVLIWSNSLGYGEITELAIFQIMHRIRLLQTKNTGSHHDNNSINSIGKPYEIRTIIDLGSGTGRVVLASALSLLFQQQRHQQHPFVQRKVIGIEIVPELHNIAIQVLHEWNYEQHLLLQGNDGVNIATTTQIDFHCCDFISNCDTWVNYVDLIFIHGTVFEDELWEQLYHIICTNNNHTSNANAGVKEGTWIVSVSRPLQSVTIDSNNDNITKNRRKLRLHCITELQVEMSWGCGTVYIQQMVPETNE